MTPVGRTTPVVGSVAARRGMTLIELIVVTVIVLGLLALVVTGLRGGSQRQKRAAETLASVLAAAQARALGVPEGAAAILAASGTEVFDGVMQPLIEATVTGSPPSVAVTPTNGGDVQRAYKIMLYGDTPVTSPPSAWFGFTPPSTVQLRGALGQTTSNTVWPKPLVGGTTTALLAQYPVKSSSVVPIEENCAIDLRFSGIDDGRDPAATPYGQLAGKGAVAVVFDRVGRVAELIQQVPEPGQPPTSAAAPEAPAGTIYFLVATVEAITSGPLASIDAVWVALAPQSGRIFVADNVPQQGTDVAALRAARAKARLGVGIGR